MEFHITGSASAGGETPPATLPIVHCRSRAQAELVLAGITTRMVEVGLRLHPDKTKIVYCKDSNRRGDHEHTSFTFLGYAFRPREARSRHGVTFTSFLPAMSPEALLAKCDRLREMRIPKRDRPDARRPGEMAESHQSPGGSTTTLGTTG